MDQPALIQFQSIIDRLQQKDNLSNSSGSFTSNEEWLEDSSSEEDEVDWETEAEILGQASSKTKELALVGE